MVVPIPWGLLSDDPALTFLVPFVWVLWQIYVPRIVERFVPGSITYNTWWSNTKQQFRADIERVEGRVDEIGENVAEIRQDQRKLKNITVAQSHMMNGYDGDLNVKEVEEDLLDKDQRRPSDYLDEKETRYDAN